MNRQKIADIIDRQSHTDRIGAAYDWFMVFAILVSLLPLMFMKSHEAFWYTELGSTLVFIIDYLLRWGTADIRNNNRKTAFITYPFSFMAIIDLLSILPAVTLLNPAFKLFRFVRLLRLTRVLKIFGISSKMRLFLSILYKERQVLSILRHSIGLFLSKTQPLQQVSKAQLLKTYRNSFVLYSRVAILVFRKVVRSLTLWVR